MPFKHSSLKGQLLLDNGKLQGSCFQRAVILICHHDEEGAFGLILNNLSGGKVGDALEVSLPDRLKQQPLFLGGPVQPQSLSFLHSDAMLPNANVMPDLQLSHSIDELVEAGESYSPTRQLKIFAGYAGWSPGQLDNEMERGTWLTHPATLEWVFHAEPGNLWKAVLADKGWTYRLLAESPEDLSWN